MKQNKQVKTTFSIIAKTALCCILLVGALTSCYNGKTLQSQTNASQASSNSKSVDLPLSGSSSSSQVSTSVLNVSSSSLQTNTSSNNNIPNIINSAAWEDFAKNKPSISSMCGYGGMLNSANDVSATYKQLSTFLSQAVPYTKAVPKSGTKPFIEYAGYLGPPVITLENKKHTVTINPAWYIETPGDGNFSVHQVSGVIEVNIDKKVSYIQSQSFYDWLYNTKWQPSFQADYSLKT